MTAAQKFAFYLPAWNRAFRANWQRKQGTVIPRAERLDSEFTGAVEIAALQLARAEARAVKETDVRHAAHVVALGRDCSSEALNNGQVNRVVALFDLLADPLNPLARERWEKPETAERDALLAQCRAAPAGYVRHLCLTFSSQQTADPQGLSLFLLRAVCNALRRRNPAKPSPSYARKPV